LKIPRGQGGGLKPKSSGKYEPNWNFPRDGMGEGVKPKISSWARFLIIYLRIQNQSEDENPEHHIPCQII